MKINGQQVTETQFAFDGCHKIYLLKDEAEAAEAGSMGYETLPIAQLEAAYGGSCFLRFISDWALTKAYVNQWEDAVFDLATGAET